MSEQIDEKPRARGSMGDFAVFAAPDDIDFNPTPAGPSDETSPEPPSRRAARAAESGRSKPVLSRMADEADHDLLTGQEIYVDSEKEAGIKGHKFMAGSSLTLGKRNAYRVNARGAVLFTPGWNPTRVVGIHLRYALAWLVVVAATAAGCLVLYGAHVGSDRIYNEMIATGEAITVTVTDVDIDLEQVSTGYTMAQDVTETATAPFTTSAGKKGAAVNTVTSRGKIEDSYEPKHSKGSTLDIVVQPENPKQWTMVRPDATPQLNWISASPLVVTFFAGLGMLFRIRAAHKMHQLGRAKAEVAR